MSLDSPLPTRSRIHWPFVLAGYGTLLVAAHYDVIRGPLIPPMARELKLDFAQAGNYLAICQVAATLATAFMIQALNRWELRTLLIVSTTLGLVGVGVAHTVGSFGGLVILATVIGATISSMGTLCNVLVIEGTPANAQGRMLSGLHAMYGLGSMLGAACVRWALTGARPWPEVYLAGMPGILALLAFAVFGVKSVAATGEPPRRQKVALSSVQILVVLTISVYVIGEVTTSMWLAPYLVSTAGFSEADAAGAVSAYFGVLLGARLLCFFFIRPEWERRVLAVALFAPIVAFAVGYSGVPHAFLAMGVYGAFFPVLLARVSRRFPEQWRSVTAWTMTVMSAMIGVAQLGLGNLADRVGIRTAFLVPPTLLALALSMLVVYFRLESRSRIAPAPP